MSTAAEAYGDVVAALGEVAEKVWQIESSRRAAWRQSPTYQDSALSAEQVFDWICKHPDAAPLRQRMRETGISAPWLRFVFLGEAPEEQP